MKKNLIVLGIFLGSLIFIGSNLIRYADINKKMDNFEDIKQLSYEINLILQEQRNILHHAKLSGKNYFFEFNKRVDSTVFNFIWTLEETEDKKFIKLASHIKNKITLLDDYYETLATRAKIDYTEVEKKLELYDMTQDIDGVMLHSLKNIYKLNAQTSSIISLLVGSALFLLIFGVIIYVREILHTKELVNLKQELQQFVDVLNETTIVSKSDLSGKITFVNDEFCAVSGYEKSELIGSPHSMIRHPDMDSQVFKEMWEKIQAGKIFRGIIKNRKKNGEPYYVDSAVVPIIDIDGDISEYLAIRYDVTEIIKSRDKAVLAEKSKDEFLSKMSHELRTPLNSIVGFSDILKRIVKDEKQLKYLRNITDSSASLLGIINDILDLSKLNSGSFSLDYHEFEAYNSLHSLLQRFEAQAEHSNITIKLEIDKTLETNLIGDWLRITQIITNLMSNALKFTPKESEIVFKASYENSLFKISVKDSGIGMSTEVQEKIFKPFEQADSSTTRKYGGTGLGLSIVSSLIKQMSGKLELHSVEGSGSEFIVEIPLESKNYKKEEVVIDEQEDNREDIKGHILIAEDNKTNQMLIGILVEEYGLTYTMVGDGVEAVDTFSKEKFDLILMDEDMPKLNGVEAMDKIRTLEGGDLPIIALTANAMKGDREKFIKLGMNEFVAKPIDSDELYRVIKSFLVSGDEK